MSVGVADIWFKLLQKLDPEKELEEFLSHNFFQRFGGGIGMTRLARAYIYLMGETKVEKSLETELV